MSGSFPAATQYKGKEASASREFSTIQFRAGDHFGGCKARLKITDSRSPVMMTGQIFFSPDKARFWPVKLMNIIIFFCPMEYRITLAVDRCAALSFRF